MIAEFLLNFILGIISTTDLAGIFFLMLLESTVFPIPSELVMPFAGFLVADGKLQLIAVLAASTLGSIAGSLISYYLGKTLGKEAVLKLGKFLLLEKKHLEQAHEWFGKFGGKTVFVCRFIPLVRHVVSIPAGIAEMNLGKFIAYTAVGALCWNSFLAIVGIQLGKNWVELSKYTELLDIAVVAGIVFIIAFYVQKTCKMRKSAV